MKIRCYSSLFIFSLLKLVKEVSVSLVSFLEESSDALQKIEYLYLWDVGMDVEGISCTSTWSWTIFSLDENDEGIVVTSVDVGNKVIVFVVRAF